MDFYLLENPLPSTVYRYLLVVVFVFGNIFAWSVQNASSPKSNEFQDVREVSDGSSCLTETESDDGSLPSKSAKRTKFDSSNESLLSMSFDLSNASIELPSVVVPGPSVRVEPTSDFQRQNMGTITPGASFSRGKYKCRHCGVFKVQLSLS